MGLKGIRNLILLIICLSVAVLGGFNLTKQASVVEPEKEELVICTSFYPIYIMALNITRDVAGVKLSNIASPDTGCLHEVQLSPAELKLLEKSDVFIVNGSGMEGYLDKVAEGLPDLTIIDSGSSLDYASKVHDSHEVNPHTWVSIGLCIEQVKSIGAQLGKFDPKNKEQYLRNTQNYVTKLLNLKKRIEDGLAGIENRKIITFHEAFPYFAHEFHLNILAVVQGEEGSEPSARELADTIKLVRENQVKAIFVEPQYPDSAAQAIARETGARVYTLDPAATGPLVADAYLQAMEKNLLTLQEALQE